MKNLLLCIAFLGVWSTTHAQNDADIRRYTSQYFPGTARFSGLGGAMGALGGDMSAIHINPAAIAVYRYGDISFTPAFEMNTIDAKSPDFTTSDNLSKLVVNNAGFVLSNELNNPFWRSINFGISFNRVNTYNDRLDYRNELDVSQTLMQDFVNEATGLLPGDLSSFSAGLAYDGYVIDPFDEDDPDNRDYVPGYSPGRVNQSQVAERNGRHTETGLNFGANYNDFLFLGASVGIQSVRYDLEVTTTEVPQQQVTSGLVQYSFREDLLIQGLGVNFKAGAIVRAGKVLRFGASFQTPTVLNLTDNYQNTISSRHTNANITGDYDSPAGVFEYKVRTPWRFMGSMAAMILDKGLISVQYEFTDFSGGELRSASSAESVDFSDANQIVSEFYTAMHTLRTGLEFRIAKSYYLRGGFAYFTNPLPANEFNGTNLDRYQYSGGFGVRKAVWNIDLSYMHTTFNEVYRANNSGPTGELAYSLGTLALTLGFRL